MSKPTVIIVGSQLEARPLIEALARSSAAGQIMVLAEPQPDISEVLAKCIKDKLEPWSTKHEKTIRHQRK